ncbi:uncharacterized protein V6R79_005222 [Siganus canaliculatus]
MADIRKIAALYILLKLRRRQHTRRQRSWVHKVNLQRTQLGEFHNLLQELRLDDNRFQWYLRVTGNPVWGQDLKAGYELQALHLCCGALVYLSPAPANSGSQFYNYKGAYSLVLLAVVDAQYCFRIIDVGGYGRTSDGGILANSTFGQALRAGTLQLPADRTLWRMYRRALEVQVNVAEKCVKATCVLHNFLRRTSTPSRGNHPAAEVEPLPGLGRVAANFSAREAVRVRETFTSYFSAEGAVLWQDSKLA